MSEKTFGFIGCGNMGGALATAACKSGVGRVLLANRTQAKAEALVARLEGMGAAVAVAENAGVAEEADYIFLGVKPQMMADMLESIAPVLAARARAGRRFVLVTMAPCAIGKGMILGAAHGVTEAEKTAFCEGMAAAGRLDWLEEHLIDAGSAVSGCGPAFAYLFMEALADGAVECGLPRAKALEYAAQTLAGAAGLVLESGQHPGALKDAVCSPGGSTIAGVHALEDGAFRATAIHAVVAAYEKTRALGKG